MSIDKHRSSQQNDSAKKLAVSIKETKMHIETESTHITPIGGNVFADLGFEPTEAKTLRTESDRVISNILSVRKVLVTELIEWVKSNNLQPADAAEIFGVARPRISDLLNKKNHQIYD